MYTVKWMTDDAEWHQMEYVSLVGAVDQLRRLFAVGYKYVGVTYERTSDC